MAAELLPVVVVVVVVGLLVVPVMEVNVFIVLAVLAAGRVTGVGSCRCGRSI